MRFLRALGYFVTMVPLWIVLFLAMGLHLLASLMIDGIDYLATRADKYFDVKKNEFPF